MKKIEFGTVVKLKESETMSANRIEKLEKENNSNLFVVIAKNKNGENFVTIRVGRKDVVVFENEFEIINSFDLVAIRDRLDFEIVNVGYLIESMVNVYGVTTTESLCEKWENSCFRANDIEEVLEQFDDVTDIKEVGHRVFVLPTKSLMVLGL